MDGVDEATSICIGEELLTLNGRPKCRASIPLEALRRHVCILGTTGSGKSTCAEIMCHELARMRVPTLVLDRTGEYAAMLGKIPGANTLSPGENLVIALFKRKDEGPDHEAFPIDAQVEDWVSLLDHFLHTSYSAGLSPLQARVLREVFEQYCHGTRQPLTVTNLILKLREYEEDVADFRGWPESIEAIVSRLMPMRVGVVGKTLDRSFETFKIADLFQPALNIIDLSVIPDDDAKNLLSQVVLKEVYDAIKRQGKTDALRLVAIVDEAQHLAPNERGYISVPERCAIELRKY
ncbi:MAG: ATP-binding protein, partial [Nitrososphaerales archaeon]